MADQKLDGNAGGGGWSPLREVPAGNPEGEYTRLAPLLEELTELEAHIARTVAVNPSNVEVAGMRFAVERIRRRIWEGSVLIDEATPKVLARQLDVTPETIRNWCNDPDVPVRHRRVGRHYYVDVRSVRDYVATR